MHMRNRILLAAATLLALCAPSLGGDFQRPAGVVELFTSQGCSSCPPADHVLDELASSGDVIALGYHVDYWDYLGWKDTLGSPENTKRQYQYGKSLGERSVYTPQAVINADAAPNQKGNAHLVLVYFDPQHPVIIQRGENRGKTINYANPVTDIQTAGMWHGKAASFEFPKSEILRKGGCAVLLQSVRPGGLPGPILGAAMIGQPAS
jgi:hypothetical protein